MATKKIEHEDSNVKKVVAHRGLRVGILGTISAAAMAYLPTVIPILASFPQSAEIVLLTSLLVAVDKYYRVKKA